MLAPAVIATVLKEKNSSGISEASSIKANEEPVFQKRELSYDKSTLPLINEMISVFEKKGTKGSSEIEELLSELKANNERVVDIADQGCIEQRLGSCFTTLIDVNGDVTFNIGVFINREHGQHGIDIQHACRIHHSPGPCAG